MRRKRGQLLPKIGLVLVALGLALRFGKGCPGVSSWVTAFSSWAIGVGFVLILLKLVAQFLFRYVPRLRKAAKAALMLEVKFDAPQPVPGQICRVSLRLTPRREKRLERVTVTVWLEEESLGSSQPVRKTLAASSANVELGVTMAAGQVTPLECSILVPATEAPSGPMEEEKYQWHATVEVKTNARTPFTATFPISVKS